MLSFTSTGTELRRFRRGLLPRLAVGAMVLVPLLYGALYLWAFWDPTGNMDRLPVALVNADTGATLDDEPLAAGTEVTDQLVDSGDLDWRLTDAQDAADGVADGTYYFAVTIPADFSADIASAGGDDPTAAQLQVTYNDANSFLASTLGRTAMAQVQSAVSATIGEQAVDTMLVGLGSARDGFATAADGALTLRAASGDLSTGAHQVADGAVSAADGAARLADGSGTLATGTDTLASGAGQLASGAATLSSGAGQAAQGAATLAAGAGQLASGASTAAQSSTTLAGGAHAVRQGVDTLAASTTAMSAAAQTLTGSLGTLGATLTQVAQQNAAAGDLATAGQIQAALTTLQTTVDGLGLPDADEQAAAAQQLTKLVQGAHDLDAGAGALSTGLGTLATKSGELAAGASQLSAGTSQVASGAQQLAGATSTLSAGATRLQTGSHDLADGAAELATGTGTLADGAGQVADGTDQVGDGAQQIADGLSDGAAQIPDDSDATRTARADVISSPVSLSSDDLAQAEGFGEGFAPFFIPLALFVGALITWLLLRPLPSRALATPAAGWRTAFAGYLPALAIGVAQVAVMLAVIHWGVGLEMSTALGTIGFTLLVAATFLALQQMLVAVLGPAAGKVAILALLMLQLASSGGTYPVETTPAFFRAIHPLLPMSYAVTGLRQTITGGVDGRLWLSVAVLGVVLLGSLALTAWRAGRLRTWSLSRLHPALTI
ncbi:membrane protein [Cellulomonas hominis]|uniref:Membrane protein n=1 Tax=Cellulomonas hominis TaxID=156981 RepID=A0A511FEI6_9CELL|nr:YhgE/Pip domain-containing protein [Cellulomonas hominis]MBB5471347.1 putative membrane protein [Cellulomonas hominis]NKY09704.1 YhgE/Pip domain-containing protein [Cellulomonas hominis]GEL47655.1 membrane protein [Cellulomonas hominis]